MVNFEITVRDEERKKRISGRTRAFMYHSEECVVMRQPHGNSRKSV